MTDFRKLAFVGLIGLGVASVACSSSSGGSATGGTSGGTGGSHTGGTTGTGGTGTSTGGVGGTSAGTGGTAVACAAATATITDFSADASAAQVGTPYKGADTGLTVPTVTESGSLVVDVASGAPSTAYPYVYVGLPFNACVDASTFTGVTFTASGTLSAGCTIQFSVVDKEHSAATNGGTCTLANCYASAKVFPLPATPTPVTIKFTDQTGGGADATAAAVDPTEILNVQWQLNVPAAVDAGGCTGTFTISDVAFSSN